MTDFKWSDTEKKIARRTFESALQKELATLLKQLKSRTANAEDPDDIWAIHDYLVRERDSIDRKYDYRYSQLIVIFARLLRENWLEENDIAGLAEEKLQLIRHIASLRPQ